MQWTGFEMQTLKGLLFHYLSGYLCVKCLIFMLLFKCGHLILVERLEVASFGDGGHLVAVKTLEVTSFADIVAPRLSNLSCWKGLGGSVQPFQLPDFITATGIETIRQLIAPAPEDFILDDESDVETTDEVNDEDNTTETYIDSALVPVPEGFDHDEEVLSVPEPLNDQVKLRSLHHGTRHATPQQPRHGSASVKCGGPQQLPQPNPNCFNDGRAASNPIRKGNKNPTLGGTIVLNSRPSRLTRLDNQKVYPPSITQ
ncbi:hypothetical protein Cgig2_017458 [Carnegiea gigantea]|uniref:Uncharacterized protein n=1 Tax=Carnegiea gigantea TaxID=171969 RepID=A0A9Q1JNF2_9CARY|nr:hypothetical protein Cgig2_017458 [Carnegiea gigantea]